MNDEERCDDLAEALGTNPDQWDHLLVDVSMIREDAAKLRAALEEVEEALGDHACSCFVRLWSCWRCRLLKKVRGALK